MSLKQNIDNTIAKTIKDYTQLIAKTYNIDAAKLLELWENGKITDTQDDTTLRDDTTPQGDTKGDTDLDPVYLLKCKKFELQALCKKRGVRSTGTKAQLIGYLQGKKPSSPKSKKSSEKKSSEKKKESNLVKNIIKKVPVIAIRKNQYGNHEHPESHLVFDNKLKKVIGVQQDDGTVLSLTKSDIDTCNKFKFEYVIPDNLDNGKLDDEKVEELDEELDDELDEEEFEEELVEELVEDSDDDELYEEEYYEEEIYE